MFTGIVEEIGKIRAVTSSKIAVEAKDVLEGSRDGDSIAVNGVCLTVKLTDFGFEADVSSETRSVTNLGSLKTSDYVNLERAMSANGRFGGHIVTGHIDGLAYVNAFKKNGEFYELEIKIENSLSRYVVKKGSITLNGISLTAADINGNIVRAALIPHTVENTNLKYLNAGSYVNIEVDIMAKYIEKFLSTRDNRTGIDMEFLKANGF